MVDRKKDMMELFDKYTFGITLKKQHSFTLSIDSKTDNDCYGWVDIHITYDVNYIANWCDIGFSSNIRWNMFKQLTTREKNNIRFMVKNYMEVAIRNIRTSFEDALEQIKLEPKIFGEDKFTLELMKGGNR